MITIKTRILYNRFPEIQRNVQITLTQTTKDVAEEVIERMQESFLEPKTGRMYGAHQASAPEEPPAYFTGGLYESFYVRGINQYAVGIYTSEGELADMLENGTIHMAPRPFMLPALLEITGQYPRIISNAIRYSAI